MQGLDMVRNADGISVLNRGQTTALLDPFRTQRMSGKGRKPALQVVRKTAVNLVIRKTSILAQKTARKPIKKI